MCFSGVPLSGRLSENLLLYFHSIIREDEVDTVYLLAKELAYDVVTGQTDNLAAALAKTSGKDIVQFANAVKISHSEIDGKICNREKRGDSYGLTGKKDGSCDSEPASSAFASMKQGLAAALGEQGAEKWPKINNGGHATIYSSSAGAGNAYARDASTTVATDLVNLNRDEKTIVAGLLAKTIEGGEVVEIRAVSSTSVMVNACYDLLSEGLGVVPYACVGLGGNFVGVVDGHITPKLAYRLKAGLSYQLSPEISAFAGGFYHRVVGDGVYDDLPAQRLVDDTSPAGRTKDTAIANFSMAYVGGEFGVRFAF
ncbi:surface antigen family protein [Anaplasma phagocytophilum str. ApNP]|uniref:Surface antigen family protein n=2 Tax=Anaplasma phagocytophilum TaxID=948 RepID=A0A0F3NHA4_ANAPH|nr:surface antigen family protein [Anaplasma phagocytophilum str. ApNP]